MTFDVGHEKIKSKPMKKDYRSSDARWRSNLKSSFQLIQRVATSDRNPNNVCGKNVRKFLLDEALETIVKLESKVAKYKANLDLLKSSFALLESNYREESCDFSKQSYTSRPKVVRKRRTIMKEDIASLSTTEQVSSQENFNASRPSGSSWEANVSESSGSSDPMRHHSLPEFDLESYILSSTPLKKSKKDSPPASNKSKACSPHNSAKNSRRLDMDSVLTDVSPMESTSTSNIGYHNMALSGEWVIGRLDSSFGQYLPLNLVNSCVHAGGDGPPAVPGSHFAVPLTDLSPVDAETLLCRSHPQEGDFSVVSTQSSTGSVTDLIIFPSPIKDTNDQAKEIEVNIDDGNKNSQGSPAVDHDIVEEFLTSEGSFRSILDFTGISE
jgi:hypothetical protein